MTTFEYWMNTYTQPNSQNTLNSIKAIIYLMGIDDKYIRNLMLKSTSRTQLTKTIKCRVNGIEYKLLRVFSTTGMVELEDYRTIPGVDKNRFMVSIDACKEFQYF